MMIRIFTASTALLVLAACGGSGGGSGPVVLDPASGFMGTTDSNTRLNGSGDKIRVTVDGTTYSADVGTLGEFDSYVGGVSGDVATHVSEGDNSRATIALVLDGMNDGTSITYDRQGTFEVPESGSAEASGQYLAYLTNREGTVSFFGAGIAGEAELTADFDDGTISGRVVDRELVSLTTGAALGSTGVGNLRLRETDISDMGSFSGNATGGALTDGMVTGTTEDGVFKGLIAGEGEVVGGVRIDHTFDGTELTEFGTFATGH